MGEGSSKLEGQQQEKKHQKQQVIVQFPSPFTIPDPTVHWAQIDESIQKLAFDTSCPPGLEGLLDQSEIFIDKIVQNAGITSANTIYLIKNARNELILRGIGILSMQGFSASFNIHFYDRNNHEIISFKQNFGFSMAFSSAIDYQFVCPNPSVGLLGALRYNPIVNRRGMGSSLINQNYQEILKVFDCGAGMHFNQNGITFEIRDLTCMNVIGRLTKTSVLTNVLTVPGDMCVRAKASLITSLLILEDIKTHEQRSHHHRH